MERNKQSKRNSASQKAYTQAIRTSRLAADLSDLARQIGVVGSQAKNTAKMVTNLKAELAILAAAVQSLETLAAQADADPTNLGFFRS